MKFRVRFKTPDALFYAIQELEEEDRYIAETLAEQFISQGEFVTIELDTEKQTATVLPR